MFEQVGLSASVARDARGEELVFVQDAVDVVPQRGDQSVVLPVFVHRGVVVNEPCKGQEVFQELFVGVLIHQR